MPKTNSSLYIAYLIRLWSETPGVWRGMLEDPNSSERFYFRDFEELLAYLSDPVKEKEGGLSSMAE
jgi:hypothetical protein